MTDSRSASDPTTAACAAPRSSSLAAITASLNGWIEVDLDALDHNVRTVRAAVGPRVELIAVVKANGYGAGVNGLAPALSRAGVDRFAVVWMREAIELRRMSIQQPVVVLGHCFPADAYLAVRDGITLTVDSKELVQALSVAAVAARKVARVHIQIDTGLHRDGVTPGEAVALAEYARGLPGVEVEGLSTHMADADEPDDAFSFAQQRAFAEAIDRLSWIPYRHTANSATALRRAEFRYDGVRVGLALHGVQPENTPAAGVRPILSVHARIARLLDVQEGESVSYGRTWTAKRPSRLALIPIGYADGWRRSLGNRGEVLVRGERAAIVGRVCMDQFVVDITDLPGVGQAEEVVLLGEQCGGRISVEEVARLTATIPWEVFAALTARLPRVFHRDGEVERLC